jgi:hypothetical protein
MKRRRYQSKKKFLEQQRKFKIKCISFSILGIALIVGFFFLMRIEQLQISSVNVQQTTYIPVEEVHKQVQKQLRGNYLFFIPKTNVLFFPKRAIQKQIEKAYTAVADVDISLANLTSLEVLVTEYAPYGIACNSFINTEAGDEDIISVQPYATGTRVLVGSRSVISRTAPYDRISRENTCFYFNEESFLFTKALIPDQDEASLVFIHAPAASSSAYVLGDTFYKPEYIQMIQTFAQLIQNVNLTATSVWTKDGEVFTVHTEDNLKIHIDPTQKAEQVFANLETLFEGEVITEVDYQTIDYIDLRFGNRVFYREVE